MRELPLLDVLSLPAGDALAFVDAATAQPVLSGLHCVLVLRRGGAVLAQSRSTPSGIHHWPDLAERWRDPDPLAPVFADVVVTDEQARFLPLSLPWPLSTTPLGQVVGGSVWGESRLVRVSLLSAPQRHAPPGFASVYAQLVWQPDQSPAAWARVSLTDAEGHVREGGCDAQGRLSLHLPLPRPSRATPDATVLTASVTLAAFFDPAVGVAARRLGAPDVAAAAAQPAVLALAQAGAPDPLAPVRVAAGEPAIPVTQGLVPRRSELRLASI